MKKNLFTLSIFLCFFVFANAQTLIPTQLELKYNLKVGSTDKNTNGEVSKLQKFLVEKGYLKVSANGYFGNQTKLAVMSFQRESKLPVLGNVGPATRKAIFNLTSTSTQTQGVQGASTTQSIQSPTEISTAYDPVIMLDGNGEKVEIVQEYNYKILRVVRAKKNGLLGMFDKNTKSFTSDKEANELQIRREVEEMAKKSQIQENLRLQASTTAEIQNGQIVQFTLDQSTSKQSIDTYRTKVRATVKRADGNNPVVVCIDKNTLYNKFVSEAELQNILDIEYSKGNTMRVYADEFRMETPTVSALPDIVCGARTLDKNQISILKYYWVIKVPPETHF